MINVEDFGAVGNGTTDDAAAIQAAIDQAASLGGDTVYFPRVGPWLVGVPIELKSNVNLQGCAQKTMLVKPGAGTTGGAAPIDCVIYGKGQTRFRVQDISVTGNRVKDFATGTVTASSYGFYLLGCAYFDIVGSAAIECLEGYVFRQCYTSSLQQATADRCSNYGFTIAESCTSLVLRNTTAFGCGGGWRISQSTYLQLLGCACDLSDKGGEPGDPMGDSGGNYLDPAYIFELSAAHGVFIGAPGCELSNSNWLYAEGSQAHIDCPSIAGLTAHSENWKLIQLRGISESSITITNPFGFPSVASAVGAGPRAIYIEDPSRQRLFLSGRWRVDALDDPESYSLEGIVPAGAIRLLDYDQASMAEGASAFFKPNASDIARIVQSAGVKKLELGAVSANQIEFYLPLPDEGMFLFQAEGAYASSWDAAHIELVSTDGSSATVLRTWSNSGHAITIGEWFHAQALAGESLRLRIRTNHVTDTLSFTRLQLTHVGAQF
ncbi:hypothetical protein CAP40_00895 [Sphingomonas sp. IBVSS2]|uniref:glycosyl hydrolase family 28-related protein n=1 Tax=Sphingomonas sp. IBVSS2 TaxID=1985172 RepID=UPI000A2E710C|nr:glycosyl hydrolase family 28-related protein [Sphingomonas sp. IBVSS2]OSZ69450.1 hypothetical protein CAP40_00895 [Sphingomonas sp. IBVSS2]